MKKLIFLALCCLLPLMALPQGRKEIKEAGIKKITTYKYEYKTGKEVKTVDSEVSYDANGNEIEVIEYDDFGKVTRHEKNTYNASNDKLTETDYDAAGKVKHVIKYTYTSDGQKSTESEYDSAGKLKKTSKYSYYGKFKVDKLTYDASNKLIQKKTYIYTK
jgi:uncharacterized protein RhaS with RHS repeats